MKYYEGNMNEIKGWKGDFFENIWTFFNDTLIISCHYFKIEETRVFFFFGVESTWHWLEEDLVIKHKIYEETNRKLIVIDIMK